MNHPIRVRFAPSPTGYLHVGSLRTALYNYLFARKLGGTFILRIEDTDRARFVPGATESLIATLAWTGLRYDEGPDVGGPHGPYLQSERTSLYLDAADRLIASGHAYPCFCTPARLEEMRKSQAKAKLDPRYDRTCLHPTPGEVVQKMAAGTPYVIRLRVPDDEIVAVDDLVRGEVEFSTIQIDDQVLLKSDGFPTYHLANVVDDQMMGVTHVIRGEEWLSSTPKHFLLYRFLGYEPPRFAHLPLLLNADRSKLSKRQGDVAAEDFRAQGYYPEALINFVAFLGWNPGDERELFSLDELVEAFSLERVGKSGAIFNGEKLRWFQAAWLRRRSTATLVEELRPLLQEKGWNGDDDDHLGRVIDLMRERIEFIRQVPENAPYFFADPSTYDPATVAKRWTPDSATFLLRLLPRLEALETFDAPSIETVTRSLAEEAGVKIQALVHPLRLAISGVGGGPGLFEMMELLGSETCARRIRRGTETLPGNEDDPPRSGRPATG